MKRIRAMGVAGLLSFFISTRYTYLVNKRVAAFTLWVVLLLIGPYVVLSGPMPEFTAASIALLLQRITGLLAFTLIFFQLVLGSNLKKWAQVLGAKTLNLHVLTGSVAYTLVLTHPLLLVFFNYKLLGTFDPFYVFVDLCAICESTEIFLTFGRAGFWLATLAVVAGVFRTLPIFRRNWRVFHSLNYVLFYAIAIHSYFVGSDVLVAPFVYFYWIAIIVVTGILVAKVFRKK